MGKERRVRAAAVDLQRAIAPQLKGALQQMQAAGLPANWPTRATDRVQALSLSQVSVSHDYDDIYKRFAERDSKRIDLATSFSMLAIDLKAFFTAQSLLLQQEARILPNKTDGEKLALRGKIITTMAGLLDTQLQVLKNIADEYELKFTQAERAPSAPSASLSTPLMASAPGGYGTNGPCSPVPQALPKAGAGGLNGESGYAYVMVSDESEPASSSFMDGLFDWWVYSPSSSSGNWYLEYLGAQQHNNPNMMLMLFSDDYSKGVAEADVLQFVGQGLQAGFHAVGYVGQLGGRLAGDAAQGFASGFLDFGAGAIKAFAKLGGHLLRGASSAASALGDVAGAAASGVSHVAGAAGNFLAAGAGEVVHLAGSCCSLFGECAGAVCRDAECVTSCCISGLECCCHVAGALLDH